MSNNNINFKINYQKGDTSALDSLKKELIELKSLTTNLDMGLTEADIQKLIPAITTVEKALNSAFDVNLNTINVQKFNQILAQSGMNAKTLQQGLSLAGVAGDQAFLHLTSQLMQFNTATKQTNKFLDSIANSFFNTIKYTAFNTILNNISGTVQKAYGYVKSLDSSLNDIRIVTGKSADEMSRFAEEANEAAKQLAVTTSDYTEGSLIYYQQGLDDETVKTLTDITAMTSNVTGQSMEVVSEQLTAVWNGYQVANQAAKEGMQVYQEYVDKMAAVGATTASDLQELATAMSKVASAASSMGVGFDDLAAQIATIVSVTRQAPESVGTALKTIYARLGDLKVDGVDEFGTKLGEVSTQLQTMGINILDTNGDMRDMSSVMTEVAAKWDTWSSAQKQAAAVAMAGKRQYNNLVALFDNWDMYGEALQTSMEAAGTLEKQQEIALDSLANKLDILSATAEDFYDSLLDETSLKELVEGLIKVVQLLADFADATGGLNNLLPLLGSTALRVFNQQIAESLGSIIINMRTARSEQEMMVQNAAALRALFSNSSLYQTQSNEATEQARLSALKELEQYYNRMQQYQSIMSQEEKEQYNNILNITEQAGRLNIELANQKESWSHITFNTKLFSQDLTSNEKDLIQINNEINKIANVAEEISLYASTLTDKTTTLRSNGKFANFEQYITNLGADYKLTETQIQAIIDKFNTLGNIPLKEKLEKISGVLKQVGLSAVEITKLESEINNTTNAANTLGDALEANLNTKQLISNITTAVGAIGQLASAISMLSNFGSIWNNDNLTDGEKFLQIVTNLSFAIPMLVSSIQTLNTTFKLSHTLSILFGGGLSSLTTATEAATAAQWGLNAAMDANPIGVIILALTALVAAVYGVVKIYDALTISAEEAAESLEETVEEFKKVKEELQSLETELDTNNKKIEELQAQESLTLIDEQELENLQVANDLLQTQIEEQKELLKLQSAKTIEAAKQAAEKDSYSTEKYRQITSGVGIASYAGDEKYKLDTSGISTYTELETKLLEVEKKASEDATNKTLSDMERMNAQAAYEYYQNEKDNILKAWEDAASQVKTAATKAQEVLPSLYSAVEVEGDFDDDNLLYGETIKYYEEKIIEYYKSSNSLERILTSIGRASFENNAEMQEFLNQAQTAISEETKTIDEDALEKILGEENFNKLQKLAHKYQISLYDIITYTKDYKINIDEQLEETEETLESRIAKISEKITNLSDVTSTLLSGKDLSDNQINILKELEAEYGELATIQDRQSTTYLNKLLEIREALEKEQIELKKLKENTLIEEVDLKVTDDNTIEDIQDKLIDVCNADYEVLVNVKADIQDDFDTAVSSMDAISKMASKIGDDFIVTAADIEELNSVFPGILANMKLVGDGTVKLNQEVVKGAMEAANAEVAANTDATIQKLQLQAEELATRRDAAKKIAKIASGLVENQGNLNKVEGDLNTALNQLKSDNSEKTSTQEQTDASNVADTAAQSATSMANSFGNAYQTMAQDAVTWAKTAHAALLAATDPGAPVPSVGTFGGASFSTTANVTTTSTNKADLSNFEDYSSVDNWQEIADYYNNLAKSYDEAYNSVIGKIGELTARGQGTGKTLENISKGLGSDGKKSGSSKDKKDKELKKLEDEFDRYWEINKALGLIDRNLKKIDKDQEKLYGKELIRSLKQENELLENQAGLYEQLYAAQQQEAAELRGQLSGMGVAFDESSGAITNYAQAVAQALAIYNAAVTAYNNGPQDEAAQKSLEAAEKAYENFKKLIERYDTLYYKEMQDTQEKLEEIWRKRLENNLKAWEVEVQLKLDWKQLERDWNDFLNEVSKDFKKVFSDLRVEVKNMLKDANTYIGSEGTINTIIDAVHDVTGEIDKLMGGGQSNMFESVSQAQEKLKELNEQLLDSATALHDLWKEAWDEYLDGIDQVNDAFDKLLDRFDRINDELAFQEKLIELLYGDEAYGLMSKLYEGQERTAEVQLQSLKQQVDMWKELFEASGATMDNQMEWNEDQQKYYDSWMNAQSKLNDLVLEYIELLKTDYLNTVSDVLSQFEKYVSGDSNLNDIATQWERISANAEKYYDSVEGAYYIQTLANKIDESIAKANNLKAQQKLMTLREKEINYLREKEDLTEYDIKAAELRYQIALKEIALQDAQQNKTGMKLTRNEQGNWSYQYVADEEDIASKRQELLDAYNDLYQLASDAYEANLEALQELQEKYLESAKAIYEDDTLSNEEREQKLLELREWYLEQYAQLASENQLYRDDLAASGAALLLEIYEQDKEAYESMTEDERALIDALISANIDDYQELDDAIKGNYKDISDSAKEAYQDIRNKAREVMSDTRLDWTSGAQMIADLWNKDSGYSVKTEVVKAYDAIQVANQKYKDAVDWCAEAVERDFSEEGIAGAIQDAENEVDNLRDKTAEMVATAIPYLTELKDYVNLIEQAWNSVQQAIRDAISLIEEYLRKVGEVNTAAQQSAEIATAQAQAEAETTKASNTGNKGSNLGNNSDTSKTYKVVYDVSGIDQYGNITNSTFSNLSSATKEAKDIKNDDGDAIIKARTIFNGATGGYTGSWGDTSGRVAILHQKELVLNADDTANFLSAINTIRDLNSGLNHSIQDAVLNAVARTALSVGGLNTSALGGLTNNNSNTDNTYNITAEFPNAANVNEIREAILSLPNIASQYANSTLK